MIRDLDDNTPAAPETPVAVIPDDQLFLDGRIRDLFDRVLIRPKARWDAATRTRQPVPKTVAEITDEETIKKNWAIIEEDALAHYKTLDYECWIVRYGTEKYACEVFKDGVSDDSFIKKDFKTLALYLLKTYPMPSEPVMQSTPVIRRPGRPRLEPAVS